MKRYFKGVRIDQKGGNEHFAFVSVELFKNNEYVIKHIVTFDKNMKFIEDVPLPVGVIYVEPKGWKDQEISKEEFFINVL